MIQPEPVPLTDKKRIREIMDALEIAVDEAKSKESGAVEQRRRMVAGLEEAYQNAAPGSRKRTELQQQFVDAKNTYETLFRKPYIRPPKSLGVVEKKLPYGEKQFIEDKRSELERMKGYDELKERIKKAAAAQDFYRVIFEANSLARLAEKNGITMTRLDNAVRKHVNDQVLWKVPMSPIEMAPTSYGLANRILKEIEQDFELGRVDRAKQGIAALIEGMKDPRARSKMTSKQVGELESRLENIAQTIAADRKRIVRPWAEVTRKKRAWPGRKH